MPSVIPLDPQPPAPPPAGTALGPLQLLDMAGKINALQQFQSKQAIGEEAQKSIHGGAFDPAEYRTRVGKRPDAAFAAPEAITQSLGNDRQNIENATALFEQWGKQNDYGQTSLQGLSNLPNPTADDVRHWAVGVSRNADPRALPSSVINAQVAAIINDPRGIKAGLTSLQNRLMGAGGAASRTQAPPGPGGKPQTMPLGGAGYGAGAMPTGQAPGEAERQVGAAGAATALESTAGPTAQYHADLENPKQDSKIPANLGGPTVEAEKKLNQLTQRVGGVGATMDKDQLRAAESFDKIANQISLNQSKFFHGSAAGLHTVLGANPNLSMSRYGRDGVIDMLQGNQDAIDVTRKMWLAAQRNGAPANSYHQFVDKVSETLDPRVFQFNRLSRENQQKFLSQMDQDDVGEFEKKYQDAINRKWVKPLKGGKQSALDMPPVPGARMGKDVKGNDAWFVPDPSRPGKHMQVMTG